MASQKQKEKYVKDINDLRQRLNIRKGQLKYALDYLAEHPCEFVKQADVLVYCDKQREIDTKGKETNYSDNSRALEILRKDRAPLEWEQKKIGKHLYFRYAPELKLVVDAQVLEEHKHKKDSFSKAVIENALKKANYKCQITGISADKSDIAVDHWNPKEKGGKSDSSNCIILNKILNEKKNNHPLQKPY